MAIVIKMEYAKTLYPKDGSDKYRSYNVRGIKAGAGAPRVDTITRNLEDDPELMEEARNKVHEIAQELELEYATGIIPKE